MKTSLLALLALAGMGTASPALAGRLPQTVAPSRYAITFEPDLAQSSFAGHETIDVAVKSPTREVVLDAAELAIHEADAVVAGQKWPAQVRVDDKAQTATLTFDKELPAGPARLELRWSG